MNPGSDIWSLVFALIAVVLILYICYKVSRFVAKRAGSTASTANIRILERAAFTQDKGLAIAEICGEYYLVGFSPNRIELLEKIDPSKLKTAGTAKKADFSDLLKSAIKGRWDLTGNDKNHKSRNG
jgi:flagellar biogenesis protein FliO